MSCRRIVAKYIGIGHQRKWLPTIWDPKTLVACVTGTSHSCGNASVTGGSHSSLTLLPRVAGDSQPKKIHVISSISKVMNIRNLHANHITTVSAYGKVTKGTKLVWVPKSHN